MGDLNAKVGMDNTGYEDIMGRHGLGERNENGERFANLRAPLNPPDIEVAHTDLPIDVTPPTTEEIRMAIRQIKSGKAARPESILAEALKSDIKATANIFYVLFRKIWEDEQVTGKKNTSSRFQRKEI
ncbi:unnamed protein product [Schistosoma curassoni]|uniref:Endo/exonuclease/phosphatase domain-containing protein n=1 Tax=Schistosoma curassoni TaxID=6186 RepID=A0A183L3D3_9TREM|nr:unnamed protein product [Schistosoma curassoni]